MISLLLSIFIRCVRYIYVKTESTNPACQKMLGKVGFQLAAKFNEMQIVKKE
ncbi:MAG: hypothetical protein IKL07_08245 [Clostridium sp.]|nr:hypothetical protein [Clostridium sp.]